MSLLFHGQQEYAKREVEFYENSSPDVISLALLVSLARKIEPELIRTLRLELSDHFTLDKKPNVGTEFTLWFSNLVESRGSDSITLLPGVSDLLRKRLKEEDPELLREIRQIIVNCHQSIPPVIKWEEDLVYYSLISKGEDHYQRLIYETVLKAAKAVQSGERKGLDEWISRMYLRIPKELSENKHFRKLLAVSQHQIIKTKELNYSQTNSSSSDDVILKIKKVGNHIEFGKFLEDADFQIQVPNISPITLTIQGNLEPNQDEVLFILTVSDEKTVIIDNISSENPPTIQTIDGRVYSIPKNSDELMTRLREAEESNSTKLDLSYILEGQHLNSREIKNLASRLRGLKRLKMLNLAASNLSDYSFLSDLSNLTSLDLRYNNLYNIDFLRNLQNLSYLDLKTNNITDTNPLMVLENLEDLDLSYNKIKDLRFLKYLNKLSVLRLTGNDYLELPKELLAYTHEPLTHERITQIVAYYEQLEGQGLDYIYEARVIIIGEPASGKTTLIRKLLNTAYLPREDSERSATIGIEIDTLSFPYYKNSTKQITAHFWDFGGQNIQYVLHQYFFTQRSLYILVADSRKEQTNFNYWFELIATLGRNCPVLVVLNENGGKPVKTFNINEYREQFGNYLESIEERSVNFYDDSDGRFDKLKADIEHKTSNMKHIGSPLPKTWVDVRKELEKLKAEKSYIEKDEFLRVCERCNITNKDYIAQVIDYLHDLGIAFNYKNDANLRNKFILQPNWIIDALYIVLRDNKIETDRGMFEVGYVEKLWEKSGYSVTDCDILLGLMQKGKFEIAYKLKENKFIVPILLPYKPEVEYKLSNVNEIQTIIEYKFMPKGIVPRLIVRLHKSILSKDGQQVVWNKGVLLSHHNSIAEVAEREQSKQISIKVSGENAVHNKEMLTIIRNEIVGIHYEWFDNRLKYEELVPCVCDVCRLQDDKTFYKLNELEARLRNNKSTVECRNEPFNDVSVRQLLEGVFIENKNPGTDYRNSFLVSNISSNLIVNTDIKTSTIDNLVEKSNNSNEINKKLDKMFANLAENQTQELKMLVNELFVLVDKKIAESDIKADEKVKEYQDFKVTSDWKAKLKTSIPIMPKLGSIDFEKEWKVSSEIKPEKFIEDLKKLVAVHNITTPESTSDNLPFEFTQDHLIEIGQFSKSNKAQQIAYLEKKNTNFIFLFGEPASGKTAVISSLLRYLMTECEYGNMVVGNEESKRFLTYLQDAIKNRKLPDRTWIGSLTEINVGFSPLKKTKNELALSFLDISGEDLSRLGLHKSANAEQLPYFDIFFEAKGLSMVFILTTSWGRAREVDAQMVAFLDYTSKNKSFKNSKILLLITKWDTFTEEIEVSDFVLQQMPMTFKRLNKQGNSITTFSIGKVITTDDGTPFIVKYDNQSPEKVFLWLYQTLTGKTLDSTWEKIKKLL
jgi:internalin A